MYKKAFLDLLKDVKKLDGGSTSDVELREFAERIWSELSDEARIDIRALLGSDPTSKHNARVVCGIHVLHLLDGILKNAHEFGPETSLCEVEEKRDGERGSHKGVSKSIPKPPPQLLSVQQIKAIEAGCSFIIFNGILGCLDSETSRYMKVKMVKEKRVLGDPNISIKASSQHQFLTHHFKILLNLLKDEYIGVSLRANLLEEHLCILLFLCFAPSNVRLHADDVAYFREELEGLMQQVDPFSVLQFLLFLKGILAQNPDKSWLKKVSDSLFVRRFLYNENGVALTIQVALTICEGGSDWRKKEAIASLISAIRMPHEEEFVKNISSQITSLLVRKDLKPEVFEIVSLCLLQILRRSSKLTEEFLLKPLIEPLVSLVGDPLLSLQSCSPEDLCERVALLHRIYVQTLPPSQDLRPLIQPILCLVTRVASLPATCHVRSSALHILVRYLGQLDDDECVLSLFIMAGLESSESSPHVPRRITLSPTANGIEVDLAGEGDCEKSLDRDQCLAECVVSILEKLKNPRVALSFYQKLTSYIDFSSLNDDEFPSNLLLVDSEKAMMRFVKIRKLLVAVNLLSLITDFEQLIGDIFSDLTESLAFVQNLLLIGKQKCDDLELAQTQSSLLVNSVMLLMYYLGDRSAKKEISSYEWRSMKNLLPTLECLKKETPHLQDPVLDLYLNQLTNLILTHGVFGESTLEAEANVSPKSRPLDEGTSSSWKHFSSGPKKNVPSSGSFEEALEDLCSPEIPIRGHGILSLTRLIEDKDEEAVENAERVFALFQHHLKEQDSYVYLLTIEGLAVLCDVFPDKVVPLLTSEIVSGHQKGETRAKLFECLARAAKRLGPLLPKYRDHFINPLLKAASEDDDVIVASSLSNLGDVCKELRFSLGTFLHEIFAILYQKIEGTNSPEVRRAAVMVVGMVLQGLGGDALKLLRDVLPRLYKKLKVLQKDREDSILQLHADVAIREIDSTMRAFFAPKETFQKRIYIKDVPPPPFT